MSLCLGCSFLLTVAWHSPCPDLDFMSLSLRRRRSHRTSAAEETAVPLRGPERSSSREEEGTGQVEAPVAGGQSMQRRKGETPDEKKQRKEQVKLAKVCTDISSW